MKYPKLLIILLLIPLVLFIAACEQAQQKQQEEKVVNTCDDNNPCTDDVFNEKTMQCEHNKLSKCCGNRICEEGERCNPEVGYTICSSDCPLECPAKATVSKFSCATSKCQQTSENTFTITDSSVIEADLENIGERGTDLITSRFKCGKGETDLVSHDKDNLFGISFRDYFNNNEDTIYLSGRQSETGGNKAKYKFAFDITKLEKATDLDCEISLQAIPALNNIQTVHLSFK
ncbi:MAG: hypothetical protein AB1571_00575 [Nanoarchaeota archaeon]